MPSLEQVELVVPITGSNIEWALALAREDPEEFRQRELLWLQDHNPLYRMQTGEVFESVVSQDGIDAGQAVMAGRLLANRAVRICVDDNPEEYRRAAVNYTRNLAEDDRRLSQPGAQTEASWNTRETLVTVFGDEDIAAALLEVKHPRSRHAAAVNIGYFCLAELPVQ